MVVPFVLLLFSITGVIIAFALPGWSDLLLVAAPAFLASLILFLRALAGSLSRPLHVILDGSNVMHWRDGTPSLAAVQDILGLAASLGLKPGVVFDANAGHLLFGKYASDRSFARHLGLTDDRILVVDRGTPADPTILEAARKLNARIITNDRFRDWAEDFPELNSPGLLIPGGYRGGTPWIGVSAEDVENEERRRKRRRSQASDS